MKRILKRAGTAMLVIILLIGIIFEPEGLMTVGAAQVDKVSSDITVNAEPEIPETDYKDAAAPNWYGGAYSTNDPFAWSNQYYGQCTWYAWGRAYERTGVSLNECTGNAATWYNAAQKAGRSVGSTPKANSIAVFGTSAGYGHVGYVEAVNGNTVTLSESNNAAYGKVTTGYVNSLAEGITYYCGEHNFSASQLKNRYNGEWLIGYIYLVKDPDPGSLSIYAKTTYYTDEDVTVSWNTPANTTSYGFTLRYNPKSGADLIDHYVTGNSYNIGKLGTGNYRLWMKPYNANGTGGTAVYVDFSVTKRPVTYVTGITLNKSSLSLKTGQTATLTASVSPGNATNKNVTWTSSNTGVASVSNGTVKAVSAGSATITAKAADGSGKMATCSVTVTKTHTHQYTAKVTRAATCAKEGVKTYTCSCGSTYTEKIAKTAHKVVKDAAVKATCTTAGRTEGSHCSVCGTVITPVEEVPATGHWINRTVTVKATSQKDGSITKTCGTCGAVETTVIYHPAQIVLEQKSYTYNGQEQKPSVVLRDSRGKQIKTTDYTVSYGNNKNAGNAKITVTLSGNYVGTMSTTFKICPPGTQIVKLTRKSKGFQVKWKKQTGQTSGYQIQYSDSNKFQKKRTKAVDISKKTSVSKGVKKLKSKKKYYVRIRTYKNVNGNTAKIYSGWSDVKTVVTK